MLITKRDGSKVEFDSSKIIRAIGKAGVHVEMFERMTTDEAEAVAEEIREYASLRGDEISVEEIQDLIEKALIEKKRTQLAVTYVRYRYKRLIARQMLKNSTDDAMVAIANLANKEVMTENANKNPVINSTQRDYIAGEASKDLTRRVLLPEDIVAAHDLGKIHFHDADYYLQREHNCDLVNLEDMLQNGTVITNTLIEKPHSFFTACNITTQIVAQVASNQYGGQSFSLAHLSPFVEISRQKIRKDVMEELAEIPTSAEKIEEIVEKRLRKEVKQGIQTIQYQLVTLMTTNGQAPFVTIWMNLFEVPEGKDRDDLAMCIEEVLKQRMEGIKNEQGIWITPAFPKLIYALDDENTVKGSKYYDLTVLAAKCTAKRMVPDYISLKVMRELKGGDTYTCMGCRSFLTPDRFTDAGIGNIEHRGNYKEGEHRYYGRFNQGVVTINLPYVACESEGDMDKFWEILNERLELCHRALRCRHERLLSTVSDVAPILWQYGALARLKKGEVIDPLLYNGYSTISLGYAGLYETCMRMVGETHTSEKGKEFGLKVMQALNDACMKWKKEENIDYSVYGTPMESTTYKFAKALKRDFGEIPEVSDHDYITNSYHINVREEIDAFSKLEKEAEFQKLSPGGAISYVEVPNMQHNIEGVLAIIEFIKDHIMYAELNTKSDYCQVCGYEGEIQIVEDEEEKKFVWECPNCKNRDHSRMNTCRRVCGYLGVNDFNNGRMADVHDRVIHVSTTIYSGW